MNKVYRVIWNQALRIWIVAGELAKSRKKATTIGVALLLSIPFAFADLPGNSDDNPLNQPVAEAGRNGTNGQAGFIYQKLTENTINDQVIVGLKGGNAQNNATAGAIGHDATNKEDNREQLAQIGGTGGNGGLGGKGGDAIFADNITITNNASITGGVGGQGGKAANGGNGGNGIIIHGDNDPDMGNLAIGATGGHGGQGGTGGQGGAGITGDHLTIINNAEKVITGGLGGQGGEAGAAGQGGAGGSNVAISQGAIGAIGGSGGSGGQGGNAIEGNTLTITNLGSLIGGQGGSGNQPGVGGQGGFDGSGRVASISANGGIGGVGGAGGRGGSAVKGEKITLNNEGTMQGGLGGIGAGANNDDMGGLSGQGGAGGNNQQGNSSQFIGGIGGQGGAGGAGGQGGTAVEINQGHIVNSGTIQAGDGGNAGKGYYGGMGGNTKTLLGPGNTGGQGGNGGVGGNGGIAIQGQQLIIENSGNILGGNAGKAGIGGKGSDGGGGDGSGRSGAKGEDGRDGKAGIAIEGSDLTIINSGLIKTGEGADPTAIHLTSGDNKITLKEGSTIEGDIVLQAVTEESHHDHNRLTFDSTTETAVNGHLNAGDSSALYFIGDAETTFKDVTLGKTVTADFTNVGGIKAENLTLAGDNLFSVDLTDWDQSTINLMESQNKISGGFSEGALLLDGKDASSYTAISGDDHHLKYSLSWYALGDKAHGTFDLKEGEDVTIKVDLADRKTRQNDLWDGQSLTKKGAGILTLTAENSYTGDTNIDTGTLRLGIDNALANTSVMDISEQGRLNLVGHNQTIQEINNAGTIYLNDFKVDPSIQKVIVKGDMNQSGTLVIGDEYSQVGQTYIQEGNWVGNNGLVKLNVKAEGDSSLTDKLIITGKASGTTKVSIMNLGGQGENTIEGIRIIETGSSEDKAFVQDGRIVAGSYEYHLQKGDQKGGNSNNWYLTNDMNSPSEPEKPSEPSKPTFRPEVKSYANNYAAAMTMFNSRLSDRQGTSWYRDPITGELKESRIWTRVTGSHHKSRMSNEQSQWSGNRYLIQMGGDIFEHSFTDSDRFYFGVMAGYGREEGTNQNRYTGFSAKGTTNGFSLGLYGTWYQNDQNQQGWYVDSWVLYNWFNHKVKGDFLETEKYHSKGVTASIETGYAWQVGSVVSQNGMQSDFYLTPQAQLIWSGVKMDQHIEHNGTIVDGVGRNNVQTRLGIRASMKHYLPGHSDSLDFEPYAELNWVHNSKNIGVRMDGVETDIQGGRNQMEVRLGVDAKINRHLNAWGDLSHTTGSEHYRDTKVTIGLKYDF